jgi:hypothetical protein
MTAAMVLQLSESELVLRVERMARTIKTISIGLITDSLSVVVAQAVGTEEHVRGIHCKSIVFRSDGQVQKSLDLKPVESAIDFNNEWDCQPPQTVFTQGFNSLVVVLKLSHDVAQKLFEAGIERIIPEKACIPGRAQSNRKLSEDLYSVGSVSV